MKKVSTILCILIFAAFGAAQKNAEKEKTIPDFSGTWILDKKKSGSDSGFGGQFFVDIKMVIVHTEPEMKITETLKMPGGAEKVSKSTFFTDGRRVSLFGKLDEDNYRIVEWNGRKLIKKDAFIMDIDKDNPFESQKNTKNKNVKMNNKTVWELSKDGKTLTQKLIGGTLPGVPSFSGMKMVFQRQD
jgi:hypothetical protein